MTFVHQPNGRMAAQSGSHDDCVMSLALAAFCSKLYPASGDAYAIERGKREPWGLHVPL